ncbi:hypothetical protein NBRC116594_22560 [Shimia sp. NS0008-38b]|uniref:hypothetical protein n=1 Tax=Shimia sp. NS0008-38b TaxID=3127653 RepID=UPI00310C37E4
MPDLDSGHIFLTTFAPILDSGAQAAQPVSFTQAARIALAKMPTAMQSPATQKSGTTSPFAASKRTHLARMFVLNDTIYNGRESKNALLSILSRDDPAVSKPVDRLNTSYLVFCAEIDAVTEDGAALPDQLNAQEQRDVRRSYACSLWETMEADLRAVYVNCVGFDTVRTADDFADYLDRCHVPTTMPFHDYYLEPPAFNKLPWIWLLTLVVVPLLFTLIAFALRIFGVGSMPLIGMNTLTAFLLGLALTVGAGALAARFILSNGDKPLPPAEFDDLPSVLKSLYLQQHFADFVVEAQGSSPQDLHQQFGEFLKTHKPRDRNEPTQVPGVIDARNC